MQVETAADPHEADSPTSDEAVTERTRNRRTARLGIGVTITFLIAMAFDWTLAYLAPVFVAPLLQAPAAPPLPTMARVLLVTFMIMLACFLVGGFARAYPLVFLVALIPALFWTFRYSLRGGSSLIVALLLIGFMLLPMVAKVSPDTTREVAASFVGNIGLALVVTMVMFALFPTLRSEPVPVTKHVLQAADVDRRAWIMTLITGSFTIAYFSFDWTNVHTPLYIAIFIQQLSLARGLAVTKGILGANVAAGLIAMILYTLIVMAPNFAFMTALSLTVILIFARMIMSGAPWAPLAGAALSSMLIILGSAMGSFGDDSGNTFIDRLGEIGAAALYAVAALYLLDAFFPEKRPSSENSVNSN